MNNEKEKKGFTLIELLVVIAIIGILATIAVVALQQARQSARDANRIANIKQMQTALELYFNDWQAYPASNSPAFTSSSPMAGQIASGSTVYMEIVPTAPTPADGDCTVASNTYQYTEEAGTDFGSYIISFCLGSQTGGLSAGSYCATPGGIYLDDDDACSDLFVD
jgi:prepilin-type N-terminal cleavage/methylation domain-containing protein